MFARRVPKPIKRLLFRSVLGQFGGRGQRNDKRTGGGEDAALPAGQVGLILHEVVDQHVDAGIEVGPKRRFADEDRLLLRDGLGLALVIPLRWRGETVFGQRIA